MAKRDKNCWMRNVDHILECTGMLNFKDLNYGKNEIRIAEVKTMVKHIM